MSDSFGFYQCTYVQHVLLQSSCLTTSPTALACKIAFRLVQFFFTSQQNPSSNFQKYVGLQGCGLNIVNLKAVFSAFMDMDYRYEYKFDMC